MTRSLHRQSIGATAVISRLGLLFVLGLSVACKSTPKPATSHDLRSPTPGEAANARVGSNLTPTALASNHGAASKSEGPEQDYGDETSAIGDEADDTVDDTANDENTQSPHPFDALSAAELRRRLREDPNSLGSVSLGRPNGGALFNAVQLPDSPVWKREDPDHAWATDETVRFLTRSLLLVAQRFPSTPTVSIGHLSAQKGGPLRPHVSHQSGRDVDVGFYYSGEPNRWYRRATPDNLDLERTWWLIRTLALETKVEMVLLDQNLIAQVERFAISTGESRDWIDRLFHRRSGRSCIVRHAPGHATHLHVRFFNPEAQQSGNRLAPILVESGMVKAPERTIVHVARPGDTLAKLALRYSTTMQAIRQVNSMKTFQLVAGTKYRIPIKGNAL